ncbi:MAG TPA: alanine racemase [Bryobacterales bacterium]|nr:alanine racemase [Bryobacterales bacterium]
MTSRRNFLGAAAGGAVFTGISRAAGKSSSMALPEVEARIAKHDFRDLYKEDLPTPCMVVDLDLFEQNVQNMASRTKAIGINVRPHVKVHKSVDVAKRQIALGAIGLTTATVAEAELFSNAGIRNVLWTAQPVGKNKITRAVALAKKDPTFMCIVDDPLIVDQLEEAAGAAHTKMNILADVTVGMTRQGTHPGQPALALAQKIDSSKNLKFHGLMGYSGQASHTHNWEKRKEYSGSALGALRDTKELCVKSGLNVGIMTGGSTGTYNIDFDNGLTELECGSYVFMDTLYRKIGSKNNVEVYDDWQPALTVMATITCRQFPNQGTIDAGNKALLRPTDEVKGMPWLKVQNQGAEYGSVKWNDGDRELKLGDRVELYPSNLDMSTNCYDRYYVARGEKIVDVWPIMGRAGAPQR